MSTQPTFAELQAQATPGPFNVNGVINSDERCIGTDGDGGPVVFTAWPMGPDFSDEPLIRDANAELMARLLNFAHAGGVQALEELIRATVAGKIVSNGPHLTEGSAIITNLRDSLAILNGKASPC